MSSPIEFASPAVVKVALEQRVKSFMASRRMTDSVEMYVKGALLIVAALASWAVLVFRDNSMPVDIACVIVLALALTGIGFNIQHDGNHGGFSSSKWVNRGAGFTLDLIGASSYFWRDKHNHNHHVYTNIANEDKDIELGWLARLSDDHRWFWFHRYQQFYVWFLYCFIHLRYSYTDSQRMLFGERHARAIRYPEGADLAVLLVGKIVFLTLAFVIPLTLHRWTAVLGGYVAVSMVMGVIFGIVFQLAHTVDVVDHPSHKDGPQRAEWVVHQIRTTANFATESRFLRVALGGLNFQREHHLFPKISHVHYPALAKVVKKFCDEHKIDYCENRTFMQAVRSHYRFVKQMGIKPSSPLAAQ